MLSLIWNQTGTLYGAQTCFRSLLRFSVFRPIKQTNGQQKQKEEVLVETEDEENRQICVCFQLNVKSVV